MSGGRRTYLPIPCLEYVSGGGEETQFSPSLTFHAVTSQSQDETDRAGDAGYWTRYRPCPPRGGTAGLVPERPSLHLTDVLLSREDLVIITIVLVVWAIGSLALITVAVVRYVRTRRNSDGDGGGDGDAH